MTIDFSGGTFADDPYYSSTGRFANLSGQEWLDAVAGSTLWNAVNNPYYDPNLANPNDLYGPYPYSPPVSGASSGGTISATPPSPWITTSTYVAPTGVKQATPDIVIFDQSTIDIEYLTNTFFEEFGGHELIKISRSDLIDGKQVSYNPIKNLSRLNQKYNPNNVIAIAPFQQNLSSYAIDLILRGIHEPYVDRENGYLVIEIDNVKSNESIEVEIATDGTMNRVIYDY
jgi:hypothetical protein